MMPITRQDIEILLDTPDQKDFVVSAYADLRVKDGFRRYYESQFRNQRRAAGAALGEAEARKALDENIEAVLRAVHAADPAARGLAVFTGQARRLHHVVPLDFPVENQLIIDEAPYTLPLLERWYGEPAYLIVVVDSKQAQIFEAHSGVPEPVGGLERADADEAIQRDKSRFIYKRRFASSQHERLRGMEEDKFLQDVAAQIGERWKAGNFGGLILLGQSQITGPLRRLLPREAAEAVAEEAPQAMTGKPEEVADDVDRALGRWHAERDAQLLAELRQRWKESHLVADGPTDVLDALQQGRATQVVVGSRRDLLGARCRDCGYRFGAPVASCTYCGGECRNVDALQAIFRMALRHRTPVHLFRRGLEAEPVDRAGGVSALLRAPANWAPDPAAARASEGH